MTLTAKDAKIYAENAKGFSLQTLLYFSAFSAISVINR